MKSNFKLLSLIAITIITTNFACKKQDVPTSDLARLINTYNLKPAPAGSIARPEFTFNSFSEFETFLKSRFKSETQTSPIKVKRYIAKSKNGFYIWDSESKKNPLLNVITSINPEAKTYSEIGMNSCSGGDGCHNANYNFADSWDKMNYDGNTDLNLEVTYNTNGSGAIGGIGFNVLPFGPTPDIFTESARRITSSGDIITIHFKTTQTQIVKASVGIVSYSTFSTTVTDWEIELDTCSHRYTCTFKTHKDG